MNSSDGDPIVDEQSAESEQKLLVTLCTYNEVENIRLLIPKILEQAPDARVLVIDDNSPDGTSDAALEMRADDERIHLMTRSGKLGLGTAMLDGFRYAIQHDFDVLINLDADFSHDPKRIPALRAAMDRADVTIGSRYVDGGGVVGWGLWRHFMSQAINTYARLFLRLKTRDNSGAYRCYRVSKLLELDFDRIKARGYAFQEEILYRCRRIGCRFAEVPIVFEDRRYGESKINWREAAAALWWIFRLGVENILGVDV